MIELTERVGAKPKVIKNPGVFVSVGEPLPDPEPEEDKDQKKSKDSKKKD